MTSKINKKCSSYMELIDICDNMFTAYEEIKKDERIQDNHHNTWNYRPEARATAQVVLTKIVELQALFALEIKILEIDQKLENDKIQNNLVKILAASGAIGAGAAIPQGLGAISCKNCKCMLPIKDIESGICEQCRNKRPLKDDSTKEQESDEDRGNAAEDNLPSMQETPEGE